MKQLLLAIGFGLIQFSVYAQETPKGLEHLVRKTVAEGMAELHLRLGPYFVLQEPPCVPRGIVGRTTSGTEVELFVKRGEVPFSESCRWMVEEFADKRIIGILEKDGEKKRLYGIVPFPFVP